MPLYINLMSISKYDAIFEVKRIKDRPENTLEEPSCFKNINIPNILHALIQIAFDELPYQIISISQGEEAQIQNAPSFCQSHVQVSVSDIRRENSDSKETSKDTRLSIGAKPVKLTFNRTDYEPQTAEHQREGSPIIVEDGKARNYENQNKLTIQDSHLSQEKPEKVKLTEEDGDVFERPLSKRRKIEKKDSITG